MSLKDIDGTAITIKYIIRFFNIFVASVTKRIFVTKIIPPVVSLTRDFRHLSAMLPVYPLNRLTVYPPNRFLPTNLSYLAPKGR